MICYSFPKDSGWKGILVFDSLFNFDHSNIVYHHQFFPDHAASIGLSIRCFDIFVYIVKVLISIAASSWSNYSEKISWLAMLSFSIKHAYDIFGMNYFPPEPTADNVLMETWEVWTTRHYRSLWRVTTYESGWMDWWLSNVGNLYAFAVVQVPYSTMVLWLSFVFPNLSNNWGVMWETGLRVGTVWIPSDGKQWSAYKGNLEQMIDS